MYVCQNQVSYIGCPKNSKLRVAYANYGRTDNHICPIQGSKPNTNCISSTSLAKTKWKCNGYSLCRLSASAAVLGDPCSGTWKYLHVRFDCVNDAVNLRISISKRRPLYKCIFLSQKSVIFKMNDKN